MFVSRKYREDLDKESFQMTKNVDSLFIASIILPAIVRECYSEPSQMWKYCRDMASLKSAAGGSSKRPCDPAQPNSFIHSLSPKRIETCRTRNKHNEAMSRMPRVA
jgi:hypothetical protein